MPRVVSHTSSPKRSGIISFDTETTGGDWKHGSRPYFFTTCDERGGQKYWEWEVCPQTRRVQVNQEDVKEILEVISGEVVGQNLKFDAHAIYHVDHDFKWPWQLTQDTLIAGHVLASSLPHNLTDMAIQYLGIDIEPHERALEKATQEARRWCRTHLPSWAIAKVGRKDMPSAKDKTWKIDAWLPKTLRHLEGHGPEEWETVLADYANADSAVTMALWRAMESELHRRGLWEIYRERMRLVPVIWDMERRGVACNKLRLEELRTQYKAEQSRTIDVMKKIAAGRRIECEACSGLTTTCNVCYGAGSLPYRLTLPKSGNNNSLLTFIFDVLRLPVVGETDTGNPSLDKEALAKYLDILPVESDGHKFIEALASKRKRDTSLGYMESYEKFWVPLVNEEEREIADGLGAPGIPGEEWMMIYPSLNQTGTDTLRMSMSNPNAQQVSKLPDDQGFTLRKIFGPAPGREWWACDYQNIELRIPAFLSGEQALIDVFLKPKDAPYYGSYHLAVFHALHPELFEKHGKDCKDLFESTWYQWCKNGNFAVLYGAQDETADRAYHVKGARQRIKDRFPKMAALGERMIQYANKHGAVETIPDKSIDPTKGYPILCTRSEWGKVLPTVPLNYMVQSSAMWCTARAMVRCDAQLREWRQDGFDGWIALQVHDEIVFDLPKGGKKNLPRIRKLVSLMCESGDDIGVPLAASAKYCPENWSSPVAI